MPAVPGGRRGPASGGVGILVATDRGSCQVDTGAAHSLEREGRLIAASVEGHFEDPFVCGSVYLEAGVGIEPSLRHA